MTESKRSGIVNMKINCLLLGSVLTVAILAASDLRAESGGEHAALSVEQAQTYMNRSFPNVEVKQVMPTPLKDFYAVIAEGRIYYMSREGDFLLVGTLYDLKNDANLTEATKISLRKESVASIRPETLLTYAPGDYRYTVRVFSDPDCPYCRKLHAQMEDFHKYGIRFDYVITPLRGDEAHRKAVSTWCSKDRHAAMDAAMSGVPVEAVACEDHPIDENMRLAQTLGVVATPAFLLEDGKLIIGYRPARELLYELEKHEERSAAASSDEPARSKSAAQ